MADSEKTFQPIGQVTENAMQHETEREEEDDRKKITYEAGGAITVLKSLCMNCEEQGVTRLLLTRIPFFRDVILMAFECEHCGFRNSEVQSAEVQERGCKFEVKINSTRDMNRQLVKGEKATITLPELDFEIPPGTQGGVLTTVEGLLDRAIENLDTSQAVRRVLDPPAAVAVDGFLVKLRDYREGRVLPFSLTLDDPSGNSFIENPSAPKQDANLKVRYYTRTPEQNAAMGLSAGNAREGAVNEMGIPEGEETEEAEERAEHISSSNAASASSAADADAAAADVEGDVTAMTGSEATTVYPSTQIDADVAKQQYTASVNRLRQQFRDMSGNVPGGFKKGGALIHNNTDRASLTDRARAGTNRDASGRIYSLMFDSSSSDSAKEVMSFPQDCFNCSARGECRMCVTDVPHFREIILMSFACDECGWKNVEVKGGGAVPPQGSIHELCYVPGTDHSEEDMIRDVIKGDTAAVEIPELELELQPGTLGGMYTTVEGLISAIKEKLLETDPFSAGDSAGDNHNKRMKEVVDGLDECMKGVRPFTLRMRDPMANTWMFSPYQGVLAEMAAAASGADAAGEKDPVLTLTHYDRTEDENMELGLLDMNAPREEEEEGEGGAAAGFKEKHKDWIE